MTAKRVREFEKLLKADGLKHTKPKAEGLRIWTEVTAENGATRKFSIATDSGDVRAELNERGRWRRWARANATQDMFVALEVLDIRKKPPAINSVEGASRIVFDGHNPELLKRVGQRFAHDGAPVNLEGMVMSTFTKSDDDQHVVEPSTTEIDDAFVEAEAQTLYPPQETDMPRATLSLAAVEPPKTPRKNRTHSQVEFFQLCSTLAAMEMTGITSIPMLTNRLRDQTGMDLSESTVTGALEATGKSLDKPVTRFSRTSSTEKLLAAELVRLMKHLGEQPSREVLAIAGVEA
jgi:hypothetical protein